MLAWIKRMMRRASGYRDCPLCHQLTMRWIKVPILFADEPPILGFWRCDDCGAMSDILSAPWADNVAKEFGYDTYTEALKDVARAKRKRGQRATR